MIWKVLEESSWRREVGVAVATAFLVTLATGLAEAIVERVKREAADEDGEDEGGE